eukprot:gene5471-9289_t
MGNSLSKRRKNKQKPPEPEPEIRIDEPKEEETVPETPTEEIEKVDPEPLIKLIEEPSDPELQKALEEKEEKIAPSLTVNPHVQSEPVISITFEKDPETPTTDEPRPKKKRTNTVLDSIRKLTGSGTEENRSLTQFSSFRTAPRTTSDKNLIKKNSLSEIETDLFTILCIGAGGAGKSTFCRQLNFEEKESQPAPQKRQRSATIKLTTSEVMDTSNPYQSYKPSIIKNIWEIAKLILDTIKENYPNYEFVYLKQENIDSLNKYNHAVVSELEMYTVLVHQSILMLIKEPIYEKIMEEHAKKDFFIHEGIHNQFKRENLIRYFPTFTPTKEDVLNCHQKTSGIDKVMIQVNSDTKIKLFDTGGQRNERKKWKLVYQRAKAVIFIASLNEFDQICYEDDETNRMLESLQLFEETINLEVFKNLKKILLLNKVTTFKQTLKESKLSNVFPEFQGGSDYDMALDFIMTEYQKRYKGDIKKFKIFTFDSIDIQSTKETFTKCKDFFEIDVTW